MRAFRAGGLPPSSTAHLGGILYKGQPDIKVGSGALGLGVPWVGHLLGVSFEQVNLGSPWLSFLICKEGHDSTHILGRCHDDVSEHEDVLRADIEPHCV